MNVLGYWSPAGRFTRLQWWRFQIWAMFGFIAVIFVSINIAHDALRVGFVGLAVVVFLLTLIIVAVKRLHDRDKSAWWLAIFYGVPLLLDSAAYAVGANLALFFCRSSGPHQPVGFDRVRLPARLARAEPVRR
jgi:uncharacterized membrane protein YhaH (DUF805 family)